MYEHPAQEAKWHVPGLQVKTVEQAIQLHTLQAATLRHRQIVLQLPHESIAGQV